MAEQTQRIDRPTVIALVVMVALAVVAVLVVTMQNDPPPADLATPEGVVQAYVTAVLDGDEQTATSFLTSDALDECDPWARASDEAIRVSLRSTTERADTADVEVLITTTSGGGPFGASSWETTETFDLVKTDTAWLIDWAPWQLSVCR